MLVDTSAEQKGRDWCIQEASYLDCGSPPAEQQAQPVDQCVICGSDEPFTGTCGSGDPRALCKQAAPKAAPPLPEGWTDCTIEFGNDGPEVVAYGPKRMMDRLAKWLGKYFAQVIADAAPKAAPGVGNSGFDHQTAADFLNGKTVSDEAVRKFVQASRWAHDEKASLSAMLLSVRGVLASREAEIALLKMALMEAEAAPQQEAQEPVAWLYTTPMPDGSDFVGASSERLQIGVGTPPDTIEQPLYTAPQPAPAPLSDEAVRDAAFEAVRKKLCALPRYSFVLDDDGLVRRVQDRVGNWIEFDEAHELFDPVSVDAALAAQGGK